MIAKQWAKEKVGEGKYHCRLNGERLLGLIVGGHGKWQIQVNGDKIWAIGSNADGCFRTINEACECLVRRELSF